MDETAVVVPVADVIPVVNQRRWERVLLGVTALLLVVLLVIATALEIQVQSRNRNIRAVQKAATTAQAASERAEKAVNAAIAAGNKQSAAIGPRFLQSLNTIEHIKAELDDVLRALGQPVPPTQETP